MSVMLSGSLAIKLKYKTEKKQLSICLCINALLRTLTSFTSQSKTKRNNSKTLRNKEVFTASITVRST